MKKFSLLFVALLAAGCASRSSQGEVLARFDGTVITEKDFQKKLESLPAEVKSFALRRRREFLEDMVAEHFLMKEAEKRRLQEEPEVKALIEAARRKIVIARLIEKDVDSRESLAPGEAEKYYQDHKEEFMTTLTLRASHILVKTEEEANLIKAALQSGADFEEMARKSSLDTTAIRGGDLGFFQRGRFVPEFDEAVFAMKKGELKGPVKSPFGYHLIKLTDRLEPALREYRDVKNFVEQRILSQKRSRAFKALIDKLKANTRVDIDDKKLEALSMDS